MLEKPEGCAHEAISTRIYERKPIGVFYAYAEILRALKVYSFLPNYGFYGPQPKFKLHRGTMCR
jgi:hypothetical protein